MISSEFLAWRRRLVLTQLEVAECLDRSVSWVSYVECGRVKISRVVELACWAVERQDRDGTLRRR